METMLLLARSVPWRREKRGDDLVGGLHVNQLDDLCWSLAVGGLALSNDSSSTTLKLISPTKLRDFTSTQLLWSDIPALGIFIHKPRYLLWEAVS